MSLLSLRNWILLLQDGGHQRLMVGEDLKGYGFKKMAEMPYSTVDGQELPVERRVTGLGWEELAAEESNGGGALWSHLFQGRTNGYVAGIC